MRELARWVVAAGIGLGSTAEANHFTGELGAYGGSSTHTGPILTFDSQIGRHFDAGFDLLFGTHATIFNVSGTNGWFVIGSSIHVFVTPRLYAIGGVGLALSQPVHGGDSPLAAPSSGFEATGGFGARVLAYPRGGIDLRVLAGIETRIASYAAVATGQVGVAIMF
jgi:hypothetical protein